jgi:hypothetical protein
LTAAAPKPATIPCPKGRCDKPHDPRKCTSHRDLEHGELVPCKKYPIHGLKVCDSHGGRAPQARKAARAELARREITEAVQILDAPPIGDPLRALQQLAGEVVAWKNALADRVDLQKLRYASNIDTEQIRGEVQLLERAMDRCNTVLVNIAKLKIDERLAAIDEATAAMVIRAMEAGLASAGVAGPAAVRAREVMRGHLTLVPAGAAQ